MITFTNLTKTYKNPDGENLTVLNGLSFEVQEGAITTIMGQSGCGKTTLLNVIAGLVDPESGEMRYDGERQALGDLFYSYVFQEPRLLEWLTVGENIQFVLKARDVPPTEQNDRIDRYLRLVGLEEHRNAYPSQLSGGMKQRVGLARALSVEPELILMDEPFGSLDEITARELRRDFLSLWSRIGTTILFVTHDFQEAVQLSDRILLMSRNGQFFHREDIDIDRPRRINDQEVLACEAALYEVFDEHLSRNN